MRPRTPNRVGFPCFGWLLGTLLAALLGAASPAPAAEGDSAAAEPRWWGRDSTVPSVSFPYVPEPVDSWVYEEIDRQVTLGHLRRVHFTSRPLARAYLAAHVAEALAAGKRSIGLERLARELAWEARMMGLDLGFEDTRPWITLGPPSSLVKFNGLVSAGAAYEKYESPRYEDLSLIGFRGTYWMPSSFSLYGDFLVSEVSGAASYGDPIFEGAEIQFNTPRYGAVLHGRFWELSLAREQVRWGPGRAGGLLLGGGSDPFAQLDYRLHLGDFLTATAIHGWLSQAENRFAAFHRVEMHLENFRVALSEGVRYDADAPEPLYVINAVPYSAVERLLTSEGSEGASRDSLYRSNFMVSGDAYWRMSPGWAVYGEFLIDDIKRSGSFFSAGPDEGVPVRIAYQFGASHVFPGRRPFTVQAEYTRVYNYTYHVHYGRDFYHSGEPLGYPLGPDVSDLNLWLDWDLDRDFRLSGRGFHVRVGEGNAQGPWCPADEDSEGKYGVDCQTIGPASGSAFAGVVERRVGFTAGGVYQPRDNLRLEAEAGLAFVANAGHEAGRDQTRPLASFRASWRW